MTFQNVFITRFGSEAEETLDGTEALAKREGGWAGLGWTGLHWAESRAPSPLPGAEPGPLHGKRRAAGVGDGHQSNCEPSLGRIPSASSASARGVAGQVHVSVNIPLCGSRGK